jgi:hypothetical protein
MCNSLHLGAYKSHNYHHLPNNMGPEILPRPRTHNERRKIFEEVNIIFAKNLSLLQTHIINQRHCRYRFHPQIKCHKV